MKKYIIQTSFVLLFLLILTSCNEHPEKAGTYELISVHDVTEAKTDGDSFLALLFGSMSINKSKVLNIRYSYKRDGYIRIRSIRATRDNVRFKEVSGNGKTMLRIKAVRNKTGNYKDELIYTFHLPDNSLDRTKQVDLK